MEHVSEALLGVSPCLCSQLAQDLALCLGPERPRSLQGSSPLGCQSHRLDASVGVRDAPDHAIAFEEAEAPRQGRLVHGERVFELPQIRLAHARDHRENAELSHP